MSEPDRTEAMRDAARDALRELIPDLIQDLLRSEQGNGNGNGNGHRPEPEIVPVVPAPPVAAVLRPSTWSGPAVAGEVVGGDGPARPVERAEAVEPALAPALPRTADGTVETVRIDNDEDLQTFVRALAGRLENPRDRLAIKSGRLRFALQRGAATATGTSAETAGTDAQEVVRVQKGAVTERHVQDAASRGARLVLARAAILTPLARDSARALGVQIEKEGKC
jgi:hypothetical protein